MVARKRTGILFVLALVVVVGLAAMGLSLRREVKPLAEGDLGDGRIFQIEGVSFGTNHSAGIGAGILENFRGWMPAKLRSFLEPRVPKTTINRRTPVLVIWLSALDATFRTNVDCQSVRLELRDSDGTVYAEHQPNWFGFERFWRVGHVFHVFPRHEKELKVKMVSWRNETNSLKFVLPNPGFTNGRKWEGEAPPLKREIGAFEVVLNGLTAKTNKEEYYRAATTLWEPDIELRKGGERIESGWDFEWTAEDAWGNRGQVLGLKKPVLKYFASFYPSGTNIEAAVLITNTPAAVVGATNVQLWEIEAKVGEHEAEILGLFPVGTHMFQDGVYLTNPPTKFGPVGGGAKTGWVSSSRRTPLGVKTLHGHYSDVPIVYVRVSEPTSKERIALRLRDTATGNYLLAQPDDRAGTIMPFIVRGVVDGSRLEAELVYLRPVTAEFLVKTPR